MGCVRFYSVALLIALVCLGILAERPSLGDEQPLVGIGGTYRPIRGESSVRLVREFIRVRFSPRLARTVVQFEFRNDGPAQWVTLGFPEQVVYDRSSFQRFQVWLDGRPLRARPTRWTEDMPHTLWTRWWVSKAHFSAAERRVLRVEYQEKPSHLDEASYGYCYLLGTGRAWKGTIGDVQFLMMLDGFGPEGTIWSDAAGLRRKGSRLAWRARNWEPRTDAELVLGISRSITDITFDKGTPDPAMEVFLRDGHLDADLREIAYWTDMSLAWSPRGRVAYAHRKGRTLALKVGAHEAVLLVDGQRVPLPFAPYLEGERTQVPMRAVCESLGLVVSTGKDALKNWVVRVSDAPAPADPRSASPPQL